ICRASTTGSASRSCRRRAASCPTTRRAPPMWAAKSSVACSEVKPMSRVGKHPVQVPQGVTVDIAGQTVTAKGKLGTLKLVVGNDVDAALKDGKVVVTPR